MRSDGRIFKVADYQSKNISVKEYPTFLTQKQNVEGLCFDRKNKRLLLAIKGADANSNLYKGIYAFELSKNKPAENPVYKIDLANSAFTGSKPKKAGTIQPSGISIYPKTSEIFIVDGPGARLLILNPDGSFKSLQQLNKKDFPQAEGITFNEKGTLFISSEGQKKGSGMIAEVTL